MFCSMKGIIMISYIKGEILYNNGDSLVVENNGIGYEIIVPAFSAQKLCAQKGIVTVFTYMSVRAWYRQKDSAKSYTGAER